MADTFADKLRQAVLAFIRDEAAGVTRKTYDGWVRAASYPVLEALNAQARAVRAARGPARRERYRLPALVPEDENRVLVAGAPGKDRAVAALLKIAGRAGAMPTEADIAAALRDRLGDPGVGAIISALGLQAAAVETANRAVQAVQRVAPVRAAWLLISTAMLLPRAAQAAGLTTPAAKRSPEERAAMAALDEWLAARKDALPPAASPDDADAADPAADFDPDTLPRLVELLRHLFVDEAVEVAQAMVSTEERHAIAIGSAELVPPSVAHVMARMQDRVAELGGLWVAIGDAECMHIRDAAVHELESVLPGMLLPAAVRVFARALRPLDMQPQWPKHAPELLIAHARDIAHDLRRGRSDKDRIRLLAEVLDSPQVRLDTLGGYRIGGRFDASRLFEEPLAARFYDAFVRTGAARSLLPAVPRA